MDTLFTALAFVAGFLLIFGISFLIADVLETNRRRVRKRLEEEFQLRQRERAQGSSQYKQMQANASEGLETIHCDATPRERLLRFVEESGVRIRAGQLCLLSAVAATVTVVLIGLGSGHWIVAAAAAPVAAGLPVLYVSIMRARRLDKLLSQLPDAFDLMSRTLRAGQTMSQALQAVADEFSAPIADEFGYCYDQQNLGLSPEAALRDLASRSGLLELKIFVLAVMIHRQTGGNFSELLQKLASVIRDRYRIRGMIKAMTADGRLQALILLALPPGMLILLSIVNRPYIMVLFQHPILLVGMFASMTIGGLWMKRIISFTF